MMGTRDAVRCLFTLVALGCGENNTGTSQSSSGSAAASATSSAPAPKADRCLTPKGCMEFTAQSVVKDPKAVCDAMGGVFAKEPCERKDALGWCATVDGDLKGTALFMYGDGDAEALRKGCESELLGVWTNGPKASSSTRPSAADPAPTPSATPENQPSAAPNSVAPPGGAAKAPAPPKPASPRRPTAPGADPFQ